MDRGRGRPERRHEPRGLGTSTLGHPRRVAVAQPGSKKLDQRAVGQVALVLERSDADRDRPLGARPGEQLVGERRLPDPELALQHDETPVGPDRAVRVGERLPFALAPDERPRLERLEHRRRLRRGRDAPVADRVVQLGRRLEWADTELAVQRAHALPVLLERGGAVAGARREVHHPVVRRLVQRVELEPAARVLERLTHVTARSEPPGEAVEHRAELAHDPPRLQRLPVVEGDAVAKTEAGEQLPAIEPSCLGQRLGLLLRGEGSEAGDVELHAGRVERHRLAEDDDVVAAQSTAQGRKRSAQGGARAVGLGLRPEEGGERVAAVRPALEREEGEQCDRLPRVHGERRPVDLDDGRAEQVEPQRHQAILRRRSVTVESRTGLRPGRP